MVEWIISSGLIDYDEVVVFMEDCVIVIVEGCVEEVVWLVEYFLLYIVGIFVKEQDLLLFDCFFVYFLKCGGQYIYYGLG